MKKVGTYIIFDKEGSSGSKGWETAHSIISDCVEKMVFPLGGDKFTLRKRTHKVNSKGQVTKQFVRNGVLPIKSQFQGLMNLSNEIEVESGVSLKGYLERIREGLKILKYPEMETYLPPNYGFGPFDFVVTTKDGFRCAVEWETGNISSSHRSINKLCLALLGEIVDCCVLIVPSSAMYPHLTDRIGNWRELQPYLAFWQNIGELAEQGILAVIVVEQDELTDSDSVPYITTGKDGRSAEGQRNLEL